MLESLIGLIVGALVSGVAVWKILGNKQQVTLQGSHRSHADEIDQLRHQFAKDLFEQKASHERAFTRVNADLAFREAEINALTLADKLYQEAETTEQLHAALAVIADTVFANDMTALVGWSVEDGVAKAMLGSKLAGEDPRYFETACSNFKHTTIFETSKPVIFSAKDLEYLPKDFDLAGQTLVYLPLAAHNQRFGLVGVFFKNNAHETRLRVLRQIIDKFCHTLFLITRFDEEFRSARIDPLTGLANKRSVYDLLPPMVARANADAPAAALIIEADHFDEMSEKYGHVVMDDVVQQLAELIQTSARVEELKDTRPPDKYVRYDTAQFLMLSQDIDGTQALAVAERIRQAVEHQIEWAGGVPSVSVSIGIALAPDDAQDPTALMRKSEVALMYLKEHNERNGAIRFDQVPRHFRMEKLSAGVSGSLQVFDPATTLQSVARAQRTGILTVTTEAGTMFWSFFDQGKLSKAYLEQFRADSAVVEFLCTFADGDFDFREYDLLDAETLQEVHALDETFDCRKSLDKNLMDGALAQDQLAEARRLIPNTRLFVKPTARYREIVASLPSLKDPPSRSELEAMQAICKHVNGRTMLTAIIDRLDSYPTHLRWHAAAVLIRHEAVELTRLALSFTL